MALTVQTLRPNSTAQLGSWTVTGGGGVAHTALSDNSDASYVQLIPRSRLDNSVLRIGFATPTIPAGARVYSVGLRRRIQTVVAGNPQPVCHHWFRSSTGFISVAGMLPDIQKNFFNSNCPTSPVVSAFVEENLGTFTTGPGGAPWDPATNLTGFAYDLGRGDDLGTTLRVSEVYLDISYQQLSTVTVTAPTGTITSTRPTVTWTYASPDSQPQQAFQVAIYTAAQVAAGGFSPFVSTPLQSSGWLLGEDLLWVLPADIADGSYSAYVQVKSKWDGAGSDFTTTTASTTFTRSVGVVGPPPPTATLSSATFDTVNNRVVLTMVPSSSSPVTAAFTVQASRDGGVTWTPIPSLTLIAATGMTPLVAYDNTAPINVGSQYRVLAYSQPSGVYVAAISYSSVLSVTTSGSDWWLKDPANPVLNTILPVADMSKGGSSAGLKTTRRRIQGTFEPLSGIGTTVMPIVVSGPTYADQGELELLFLHNAPTDYFPAWDQLDRSGHVLLLQKPNGDQAFVVLGPGSTSQDTETHYDAQPGVPSRIQWRRVKTGFTQVATPAYY